MANIPTWNQALPDPGFYTQDALRKAQEYQARQAARVNEQEAAMKQAEHESKSRIIPLDMVESNFADNVFYGDKDKAKMAVDRARQLGFVRGDGDMAGMSGYDLEAFKRGMMLKKEIGAEFARNRYDAAKRALIEMEQEAKRLSQPIPGQGDATNRNDIIKRQKEVMDLQMRMDKARKDMEGAYKGWASGDPEAATKYGKLYEYEKKDVGGRIYNVPSLTGFVLGEKIKDEGIGPTAQALLDKAGKAEHVDAVTKKTIDQSKAVATGTFARSLVQNKGLADSIGLDPTSVQNINEKLNGIINLAIDPEKAMLATEQLRALLGAYPQLAPLQNIIDDAEKYAELKSTVTGGVGAAADFTQMFEYGVNNWKFNLLKQKGGADGLLPSHTPKEYEPGSVPAAAPQPTSAAPSTPSAPAAPAAKGPTPVPQTAAQFTASGKKMRTVLPPEQMASDNALAPVTPAPDNTVQTAPSAPKTKPKETENAYYDERMGVWVSKDKTKMWIPRVVANKPPYGTDPKTRKPMAKIEYVEVPYNPSYVKPNPGIFR